MTLHASSLGRGHRDDRRRRLLAEDLAASAAAEPVAAFSPQNRPPLHKSENYGDAEFLKTQSRLTDLIPRRLVSYLLLFKAGLAAIAGLVVLGIWAAKLIAGGQVPVEMAELGKCGSLGNWFGSLLLLLASALAAMNFNVRRHKVDDYRGHYRVWLWAAAAWFLAATDSAANLHQALQQVMVGLTGWRLGGDGSLWWIGSVVAVAGAIGFRLFLDMRPSRLSTAALMAAGGAYLTALVAFFHGIALHTELAQRLLVGGLVLAGHLLAALSMGLHARFVILDAEGALPKREKNEKKRADKAEKKARKRTEKKVEADDAVASDDEKKVAAQGALATPLQAVAAQPAATEKKPAEKWVAIDPPHSGLQPAMKRVLAAEKPAAAPAAPTSDSGDAATGDGRLNKADRKAMKKRLLDERLKREQRKAANW